MRLTNKTIAALALGAALMASAASSGDLVRVDLLSESAYSAAGGVFGELGDSDVFDCGPAGSPDPFDLLDFEDDDNACFPAPSVEGVIQSDLSGGGRWKLALVGADRTDPIRAVGISFSDNSTSVDPGDCAALAALALGGEQIGGSADTCSCVAPCFVQVRMDADRVFKKGATRQAFSITVLKQDDPVDPDRWRPEASINYIDPLFICPHPTNPDVRYLQTDSCDLANSVAEAEVCPADTTTCSGSLGRWNLPIRLFLHRVPRPGADGGGGGCGLLLPKGAACETGSECCSGKCTGKSGAKTCK